MLLPEIAEFDGIKICMYYAPREKHQLPHFHALYGEKEASFLIDGQKLLAGSLPRPQRKQVQGWAAEHETQLAERWDQARNGQRLQRIS